MDDRENLVPVPHERGPDYALDENISRMELQYRSYENTMRECISGLMNHAARLAVQGREEPLPRLREICIEMAEFWNLSGDDSRKGFQEMAEQCGGAFDLAVSSAKASGCAFVMSEHTKQKVLDGLDLYAREMMESGDLEKWIAECNALSSQLRAEWGMEPAPSQGPLMELGGM